VDNGRHAQVRNGCSKRSDQTAGSRFWKCAIEKAGSGSLH
jgi:hypothetical protein